MTPSADHFPPLRVLSFSRSPERPAFERAGEDGPLALVPASDTEAALVEACSPGRYDALLLCLDLDQPADLATLQRFCRRSDGVPLVLLPRPPSAESLVTALRLGAADCLLESELSPQSLGHRVRMAVERNRLAERLDTQGLYRRALSILPEGVALHDRDGNLLFANQALAGMLGRKPDELTGAACAEVFGCDPAPTSQCAHVSMPPRLVFDASRGGHWYEVTCRECAGRPLVRVRSVREVTARKRAEEALRHGERRFRAIVEGLHDLVTILDARGRIVFEGPSSERVLGYLPEEMIGRHVAELLHPEDSAAFQHLTREHSLAEVSSGLARVRHKDGRYRTLEFSVRCDLEAGDAHWHVVHARDVTETRLLEQQLAQALRVQTLGQLASGVAHDFNNLLAAILCASEMLERELPEGGWREDVRTIRQAAQRGANLTRQLLLPIRKQVAINKPVCLGELVHGMARMLLCMLRENITFSMNIAPRLPLVRADRTNLEQVVMNLVLNGRDAMPSGGALTVAVDCVHVENPPVKSAAGTRWVRLSVKDSGLGIPPEVHARIFEPFFTTKAPGAGTGLGLPTVAAIVESSGGWIDVRTAVGQGSEFLVYLPALGKTVEAAPGESDARPEPRRNLAILLVEDNVHLRAAATRLLERASHRVVSASTALEARQLFEGGGGGFDAVMTDQVLPDGSGLDLVFALAKRKPDLAVVVATGQSDSKGRLEAEDGFVLLPKPFGLTALIDAIERALKKAAARRGERGV